MALTFPLDRAVSERYAREAPDVRRRARLSSALGLLGVGGAATLVSLHVAWVDFPWWFAGVPILAGVGSLGASLLVLKGRSLELAAHLAIACWLVTIDWGIFLRGGLAAGPLMCLGAPPLVAIALLGRSAGWRWAVPSLLPLPLLGLASLAGYELPDRIPPAYQAASDLIAAAMFSGLLVAMGVAQEWLRTRTLEELREAERRKLAAEHEARLAASDRLASLGQLAAGVAHELNNPLTYLQSNLELIDEQPLSEDARASLRDAIDGAGRLGVIVRDLKAYSRVDDELGPVALPDVVRSGLRIAAGQLKQVEVRTELGPCPRVEANETRLGQVLVNLLVNSVQAAAKTVVVATRTDPAGNAVLSVRDTGQGIPPHLLRRVVEPFFTTKPVGVGTGLGLAVCDRLVRQLGGVMQIESAVGQGTTVTLVLPPLQSAGTSALGRGRPGSGETSLAGPGLAG